MTRAHGVLALLLAAALVWAYALTRTDWWPATDASRPVAVFSVEPRDVLRLEYAEGNSRVVLKSDPAVLLSNGMPAVWIEAEGPAAAPEGTGTPPAARAKASKSAAAVTKPGTAASKTPSKTPAAAQSATTQPATTQSAAAQPAAAGRVSFRGGIFAAAVLQDLARLSALRDLGRVSAQQLESFGLAKPSATLRLERKGGEPLLLNLGNATFGGVPRYAQLQPGGRVFLVPQSSIRQLERPRRLMEREWLPFNLLDAESIEAKLGARTLTVWRLIHAPRTEPQRWARQRDATQGEPAALAWTQSLAGVKVLDYLDAAAVPAGSETVLEVTVRMPAPASAAASAAAAPAPVVLRVFKGARKEDAGQLRAVSGYTGAPVALSAPAVQAVLDQARPLLDSR
jgi:hypothetical protein